MFDQVKTHAKFIDSFGEERIPVATLKNRKNAKICHIAVDTDCYVVYLPYDELGFVPSPYIFPEAHRVLAGLPALYQQ